MLISLGMFETHQLINLMSQLFVWPSISWMLSLQVQLTKDERRTCLDLSNHATLSPMIGANTHDVTMVLSSHLPMMKWWTQALLKWILSNPYLYRFHSIPKNRTNCTSTRRGVSWCQGAGADRVSASTMASATFFKFKAELPEEWLSTTTRFLSSEKKARTHEGYVRLQLFQLDTLRQHFRPQNVSSGQVRIVALVLLLDGMIERHFGALILTLQIDLPPRPSKNLYDAKHGLFAILCQFRLIQLQLLKCTARTG